MPTLTIEYIFLSLALISMIGIVLVTTNSIMNDATMKKPVISMMNEIDHIMGNIYYYPVGSEFVIGNPNNLIISFYQGQDPNGDYYVQISVIGNGYSDSRTYYEVRMKDINVGQYKSFDGNFFKIIKVGVYSTSNGKGTEIIVIGH